MGEPRQEAKKPGTNYLLTPVRGSRYGRFMLGEPESQFALPAACGWRCTLRKEFTPDGKESLMKRLKQCLLFPKTNCGCGLVTLALALAWPAHGADPVLIGQWPGWPREGYACGVAVSGNYAYVADENAGLQVIDVSNPANPQRVGGYDTSGYCLWRGGERELRLRGG